MQSSILANESKVPDEFICPISREFMSDPYATPSGRSFQKEAIIQWVKDNRKDPFSQKLISERDVVPNVALKLAIQDYRQMNDRVGLLEIYHQRGSSRIQEIKKYLDEINKSISIEEKGQDAKFVVDLSVTLWPFPVICPKSSELIIDPIIEADGSTYQKPKESKQQYVTNYNLKNTLQLFPIKLDNKLNFQINKIKRLIKQANQANEKILVFQRARAQARQAELEREVQQLRRALADVEIMNRQKRRKKYFWGAAAVVAASYAGMCIYDYFYGEEQNTQNAVIPTSGHWFASALLKPIVTTATAAQSLLSQLGKVFESREYRQHQQYLKDCIDKQSDQCTRAVAHALSLGREDLLKQLHESIDIKYFINSLRVSIIRGNFNDVSMLLKVDPKLLELTNDALHWISDGENGIRMLDYIVEKGYSINRNPHNETGLMWALKSNKITLAKAFLNRGASIAPCSNNDSPLYIAIRKWQFDIIRILIARDQPLAKKMIAEDPEMQEEIIKMENLEFIRELISNQVFNVNGSKQFNPLFAAFTRSKFATFKLLVLQGASIERFVERLEEMINLPRWDVFLDRDQIPLRWSGSKILKLFETGLIFNENNIAQKVLVKALGEEGAISYDDISLIELLVSKGITLPDSFNFKEALARNNLYDFNQHASRCLTVLLKASALRKDFENIIKEINPHSAYASSPRALAMIINAGYQLDIKSWWIVDQNKILIALEELNKLEELVVKNDVKQRIKGLQGVLLYATHSGYKDTVKKVLKTNLMDYETVKQASLIAHKLDHSKAYPSLYNLLRNHMRTLSAPLIPSRYAFHQPAQESYNPVPKESQRRIKRGR